MTATSFHICLVSMNKTINKKRKRSKAKAPTSYIKEMCRKQLNNQLLYRELKAGGEKLEDWSVRILIAEVMDMAIKPWIVRRQFSLTHLLWATFITIWLFIRELFLSSDKNRQNCSRTNHYMFKISIFKCSMKK